MKRSLLVTAVMVLSMALNACISVHSHRRHGYVPAPSLGHFDDAGRSHRLPMPRHF